MDCNEARPYLLSRRRGTLDPSLRAALEAHLAGCPVCGHEDAADRELSTLLEDRLPKRRAPASLGRALRARWDDSPPGGPPRVVRRSGLVRTMAAVALGVAIAAVPMVAWRAYTPDGGMVTEAVNDHLRVLYSQRPLEVESGGMHQVKPWFEGRLDFAPVTAFAGDDEFPLQGGLIGYFVDRKAATFVFKRRLHVITLFVFPSAGLHWSTLATQRIGTARGSLDASRGFHVLLWRQGDLGYAMVSDVNDDDLLALGARIAGS